MPSPYSVEQYILDLRAIRNTGAATVETSFYPPLSNLLNAVGDSLKPRVIFSTQLEDSLGITFEGERGDHFFRSTLVQTLFYSIFSAWALWRRSPSESFINETALQST